MAKNLLLRVKTKSGQHVVQDLTSHSTVKDLKDCLSRLSEIPRQSLQVLSGFPPKPLDISNEDSILANTGITTGDTLILQENLTPQTVPTIQQPPSMIDEQLEGALHGILMKQVVPADNSCLFGSFHFVFNGKLDETGERSPFLRSLVAETILTNKTAYDEAILGKPVDEYCAWIQNDTSWGGAIELAILSNYFGIEIGVVDTVNGIINRFGEDQNYGQRVLLMFDGIHYDPLYLEPFNGGPKETIFDTADDRILAEAKILAEEAKSSRQFTDVNKFTIKCLVCNIMLKGQVEAQTHARTTGHTNFGEV